MDSRYRFLTLGIPWTQSMPSRDVNAATRLAEASWRRDNIYLCRRKWRTVFSITVNLLYIHAVENDVQCFLLRWTFYIFMPSKMTYSVFYYGEPSTVYSYDRSMYSIKASPLYNRLSTIRLLPKHHYPSSRWWITWLYPESMSFLTK